MKYITLMLGVFALALPLVSCDEAAEVGEGIIMTGTASDPMVKFAVDGFPASYSVSATATDLAKRDVRVSLSIDGNLVDAYNAKMGTSYYFIPETSVELSATEVLIKAGTSVSEAVDVTIITDDEFVSGRVYLIPVTIRQVDGDFDVIEAGRTLYLKVSRTLRFHAPYVGQAAMAYQFLFPNPITSLPVYTFEVKIYATQFRATGASGTTRVCSFGGNETSVEGGAINDGGFKCDQNLIRFGEGTDPTNLLHITTKQGKMSAIGGFNTNQWYAVALVNDGSTLTLYIDGEKNNSMTVSPYEYTLYGVQIGMPSSGYQSSQLFYGRLSEMRLWTRPLSAREIKANVCGVDPSTNGLVSYWRMDEGSDKTFYDSSPAKRDIGYSSNITINWTYDDTNKCVE